MAKYEIDVGHLDYCKTQQQKEVVSRRVAGASLKQIADDMGLQKSNVGRALKDIYNAAARQGYAPTYDMTRPVPDGFSVKGVSTYYDEDGKPRGQWVKSQSLQEQRDAALLDAITSATENIKPCAPIKSPRHVRSDLLNLLHVTDYHLSMYAAKAETGGDWDCTIAEREFVRAVTELIDTSPDAETGIFSQGGDFLHYDSLEALTPANKHILDADTRAFRMVELALNLHIFAIEQMLQKHRNVVVIIQEGNHDPMSSIWLRKAMKQYFSRNKRVEVLDTEFPFYAYLHGSIMLAFHHGHKVKNKSLPALFASEPRYRAMWGKAQYCYVHTGHYHQREQDQSEFGGAVVERHPTIAARDAYAARGGYVSWRAMNCITYHKTKGEVSRRSVVPDE
jgi:hypothetical protein